MPVISMFYGIVIYLYFFDDERHKTVVTRYNIAYINHIVFSGDNGRVLGYDNAHGYHHRHWMGSVEPFEFKSYADVVERFRTEWKDLVKKKEGTE